MSGLGCLVLVFLCLSGLLVLPGFLCAGRVVKGNVSFIGSCTVRVSGPGCEAKLGETLGVGVFDFRGIHFVEVDA